jgi:SAM-dependent methyltransferase
MRAEVARRLLRLNAEFYERFAGEFAESRAHVAPGMARALDQVRPGRSLLDAGCGDGRAAQALAAGGWSGAYVGVDRSAALLARARSRHLEPVRATFIHADLAEPGWDFGLPGEPFDAILALAVLHHIPGARRRLALARRIASAVRPGGRLVFSTWQFLADERLRRKVVPWERLGLQAAEVEPGGHLLDWKRGGEGLRYVCALGEADLRRLAHGAGCAMIGAYQADGRNGRLSLYAVWARRPAQAVV